MEYDFSGYATKHGIKCSDGRTIMKDAFKDCDGKKVPLCWQHFHDDPKNVLGHAVLEAKDDGVYAYCKLNGTEEGTRAAELVKHGDIQYMSIYANQLQQRGGNVYHGNIREVSLVLAGANPGARIDNLSFKHSDGWIEESDDEAIIHSGERITFMAEELKHEDDETLEDVFNTLTDKQKNAVYAMLAMAVGEDDEDEMEQSDEEDDDMRWNAFEQGEALQHDAMDPEIEAAIFQDAMSGGSLRDAFMAHADDYGITNIDMLFPEAKQINGNTPEWIKRNTEWVQTVLNGCKHSPFSRIKMVYADITADTARAKGYIKGNMKKEEFFALSKRAIGPCTIYKKQKLDRDDIIDVTSFDVVAWIKGEMRLMLNEEIARAILIGDGRDVEDEDKINENCLIPITKEHELYAPHVVIPSSATVDEQIEYLMRAMQYYEGTGTPRMFTYKKHLIDWKLLKDKNGRYIYDNVNQIADKIGLSGITDVEVMKDVKLESGNKLMAVIVNLADYTIGADKGGQIEFFDDFDIDYNQYKYLYETRISGCLTKLKSAIIVELGDNAVSEKFAGPSLEPSPVSYKKGQVLGDTQAGYKPSTKPEGSPEDGTQTQSTFGLRR